MSEGRDASYEGRADRRYGSKMRKEYNLIFNIVQLAS